MRTLCCLRSLLTRTAPHVSGQFGSSFFIVILYPFVFIHAFQSVPWAALAQYVGRIGRRCLAALRGEIESQKHGENKMIGS